MKMRWFNISKLKFVNFIYWVFLTYMIAAFIWWYVSLEKQNSEIATVKFQSIRLNDPALYQKVKSIEAFEARKTKQYIYEGVTFLFLFLLGAIYVYRSLLKQLKISGPQAQEVLQYIKKGEQVEYQIEKAIELPKEFQPLYLAPTTSFSANIARKYLYDRGITDNDILKHNIGYCIAGEFSDRIIIPSYDQNNQLNFYVARSFNRSYAKYKNPEASKDIIVFENLINWNQPIIICEGVFDAMAIRRNAIPILGKNISKSLLKKIVTSKVKEIYIALDRDALKKAVKFCEQFISMGKKVYLVDMDEKDPSEMGFENFTNLIQNTYPLTTYGLMSKKIELI